MMDGPVVALVEAEYRRVWDRFHDEFKFRPSMSSSKWPGIKEPVVSATWSLVALDDDPGYERLDRLVEVVEQGLAACIGPSGTLLALDWRHTSYRFAPRDVGGPGRSAWPLSPFPDGDYYVYLSEDFRLGSFGHPWEMSLCLFGEEFLGAVSAEVEKVLGRPIRRSGRAAGRS